MLFKHIAPAAILLLALTGCANDQPVYVAPKFVPGSTVTLKGRTNTSIVEVDRAVVPGHHFSIAGITIVSDPVLVSPGTHSLTISQYGDRATVSHWFTFNCYPGHTYTFSWSSFVQPFDVAVTDENTKEVLEISPQPQEDQSY